MCALDRALISTSLKLGDGAALWGAEIPHDKEMKRHSDADAAMHALTDANLRLLVKVISVRTFRRAIHNGKVFHRRYSCRRRLIF